MKVLLLTCVLTVLYLSITARASADRLTGFWDRVARCETQGNWQMSGSLFSGGVGFANSTWRAWAGHLGLLDFYPTADRAPRLVQIVVAQYGLTQERGYWGCLH